MKTNDPLVKQLKDLLLKGNAHVTLDEALDGIPDDIKGKPVPNLPYTLWQITEHIRITQWDILEFSYNPKHISPKWPDEHWPKEKGPKDDKAWDHSVHQIKKDRQHFIDLLEEKDADFYTPFPWGDGQNLLREALLIADHNSYHTGELIVLRRLLGHWK